MKKVFYAIAALAFIAGTTEVFQQLKTNAGAVQEHITTSIENGYLSYPSSCRTIAMAARLEIAKTLLPFAKEYTHSNDFKERYQKWWKAKEPNKPATLEERKANRLAEKKKSDQAADETVTQMKQQIASTTDPTIKKALQDGLKAYEEMQKQMATPEMQKSTAQMQASLEEAEKNEYLQDMDVYNREHAEWQRQQNPNYLLKQRFEKYLSTLATVDFNAKVVSGPGGRFFENHDYQTKPAEWKQIYRTGKDVNDYVKGFVQQWEKELTP